MKKYPLSDHYNGKRFFNEDRSVQLKIRLLDILKFKFLHKKAPWPTFIPNTVQPQLPLELAPNKAAITFVNHATLLIQFSDLNILTDPVFSKRVSPLSWLGPKRVRHPGVTLAELPRIDLVTISHNHYDHLDLPSLRQLNQRHQPLFVVPLGNARLLQSIGITKVIELDWWQTIDMKGGKLSLTPAQHWSARGLHDQHKSLWGSFVFSYQKIQIYFAGDTGYSSHFTAIYKKFGAMTVSLLPIGAYEPRWLMKYQHMNPDEAVQAHLALHSQLSIGMHFGTFSLANEAYEDPILDLAKSLQSRGLPQKDFITLEPGETKLI